MIRDVCAEFEPVDLPATTAHLNLDSLAADPHAIEQFRVIERNESRRAACADREAS